MTDICRWCGKIIKKGEAKVCLTHNLFYDHLECNKKRQEAIKERYGIDVDYTKGQKQLGDY